MQFDLNVPQKNFEGKERRVGFEFESAQLSLQEMADVVRETFGGSIKQENEFCYKIIDSEYGKFSVESDSSYLKDKKYESKAGQLPTALSHVITESLVGPSRLVVPNEIVTPPIRLSELSQLDILRANLYARIQAKTAIPSIAPCGFHINPEITENSVEYVLRILQSFVILQDDLFKLHHVALLRRLWPYIAPFPKEYADFILNADYRPDFTAFVKDYLAFNPSRNRALDLLPLLAWMDPDRLKKFELEEAHLIGARPTFHCRLPNCELSDPDWTVAGEWNNWVTIEKLAADTKHLESFMRTRSVSGMPREEANP